MQKTQLKALKQLNKVQYNKKGLIKNKKITTQKSEI